MAIYQAPTYTQSMLAQMDESQISYPYNDEYATYNGLHHQYQLTRKYFEERGVNLAEKLDGNNPDKINNFLNELRIKVYTTIYNRNKSSHNQINFLIAKRGLRTMDMDEFRASFLEAMYLEGVYLLENGDVSMISGVDLDTMQNMSADVIRHQDRDWSKDALLLLQSIGLNYQKRYDFYPQGKGETW